MKVTLLGTGNPLPDPNRAGPSTLVQAGDDLLLVDCGRGVLQRLVAAGVLPVQLHSVWITHLHSDHLTDLSDVVTTHWVMSPEPTTLRLFGPPRTGEVVDGMLMMLGPDIGYRMAHHADLTWRPQLATTEVREGVVVDSGTLKVVAAPTDHRPVEPTVGYRIEHADRAVVIAGDTVPCDGLDRLCAGADVYVQTVLRDDLVAVAPMQRFRDTIDYHSSVVDAAKTARQAGVRTLVLTHFVPTFPPGEGDEWHAIAREHFDGEIVVGDDLTEVAC
jgi:ribonuclease Z